MGFMPMEGKKNTQKRKRGFIFTAGVVLIITFMIGAISLWLADAKASDQLEPEDARLLFFSSIVERVDLGSLYNVFNRSSYYAMYRVNSHAAENPLPSEETALNAMANLTLMGSAKDSSGAAIVSDYSQDEMDTYTLAGYFALLNRTIATRGYLLQWNSSGYTIRLVSPYLLEHTINLSVLIYDSDGNLLLSRDVKNMAINQSIIGFEDPLLDRMLGITKQIFPPPAGAGISGPEDLRPRVLNEDKGIRGKGWYYGEAKLLNTLPANSTQWKDMIIVIPHLSNITSTPQPCVVDTTSPFLNPKCVTLADILAPDVFGAIILESDPNLTIGATETKGSCTYTVVTETGECLDCLSYHAVDPAHPKDLSPCSPEKEKVVSNSVAAPFIAGAGAYKLNTPYKYYFSFSDDLLSVNRIDGGEPRSYALIDNSEEVNEIGGYHYELDIEPLRDSMVCSYFVSSSSAPNYLQRLIAVPPTPFPASGNANGIETFLVGKYVSDTENPIGAGGGNLYSKLDREFLTSYVNNEAGDHAHKVKGMPGCKNKVMCTESRTALQPVGIFALKSGSGGAYTQYVDASGPIDELSLLCPDSSGKSVLGMKRQSVCE
ncbi:hypothetical protein COT30_04450 [Candidatus Micrarchaeota archaeon CG08_land_8_20_14_0_20_49_17]|nr:MAG: hypothetical protein AUJ13_05670 [Candidatus Micrarchaeota archaeon CG1_02_49_24]PIU09417.1 MAG: hypothetical protein COT30_04450 [Candidatus Micrarchaeota archaeon CG08_land_8_20_14_0_20_49_17]HII53869.1 hypothetical protein [Candidatus Micrarchaeota archaeon]